MRSLLFAAVLGLATAGAAHAHEYSAGDLRIAHPWTRVALGEAADTRRSADLPVLVTSR